MRPQATSNRGQVTTEQAARQLGPQIQIQNNRKIQIQKEKTQIQIQKKKTQIHLQKKRKNTITPHIYHGISPKLTMTAGAGFGINDFQSLDLNA